MEDCVFCKIVKGEISAEKVLEDENHLAFLGLFPRFPGMSVVIPKAHRESYLYETLSDDELIKLHLFTKKVAGVINKALGSYRCIQVMEGFDVNHGHLKLFPVYRGEKYNTHFESENKTTSEELKKVAEKIRSVILKIS